MAMLPQPPPNADAPPPSKAALLSRRKWRWLLGVGGFSVFVFVVLLAPLVFNSRKKSSQTEAIANARKIGMALFEFEAEYGKFPDATTIAAVRKRTGSLLPLGTKSSNDFFRQLIASEITESEAMFYAKTDDSRKPDNRIEGVQALEKGECGFSYLAGLSRKGNSSRPLLVTPLIPGTDRFDPTRFAGKAIVLKMDNSVTFMNIDRRSGHVIVDGRNLMDPRHPIWDGHAPVIAWPE